MIHLVDRSSFWFGYRTIFRILRALLLRLDPLDLVGPRGFCSNKQLLDLAVVALGDPKEVEHLGRRHDPVLLGQEGRREPVDSAARHEEVLDGG